MSSWLVGGDDLEVHVETGSGGRRHHHSRGARGRAAAALRGMETGAFRRRLGAGRVGGPAPEVYADSVEACDALVERERKRWTPRRGRWSWVETTPPRASFTNNAFAANATDSLTASGMQHVTAILDRYVQAGGTFIGTSDNYAFWVHGTQGEDLLGRWRRRRGTGDSVVTATMVGARPLAPGRRFDVPVHGLSARAIKESAERSMGRT